MDKSNQNLINLIFLSGGVVLTEDISTDLGSKQAPKCSWNRPIQENKMLKTKQINTTILNTLFKLIYMHKFLGAQWKKFLIFIIKKCTKHRYFAQIHIYKYHSSIIFNVHNVLCTNVMKSWKNKYEHVQCKRFSWINKILSKRTVLKDK